MCEKCWTPKPGNVGLKSAAIELKKTQDEVYEIFNSLNQLVFQGRCAYVTRENLDIYKKASRKRTPRLGSRSASG